MAVTLLLLSCEGIAEFPVGRVLPTDDLEGEDSGAAAVGGQGGEGPVGGACQEPPCLIAPPASELAVGIESACDVREGQLRCWGRRYGTEPLEIAMRSEFVGTEVTWQSVSTVAGESYCALSVRGALYCWGGDNGQGNLGGVSQSPSPQLVDEGPYVAVYQGSGHGCVLNELGALWCWGRNTDGELGLGDTQDRFQPTRVPDVSFVAVAVGWGHTCALDFQARLYCWGRNQEGQLGLGDRQSVLGPHLVSGQAWSQISASQFASCGVLEDGSVSCWGQNSFGRLGSSQSDDFLVPNQVSVGKVRKISVGRERTCAVSVDEEAICWGLDGFGNERPPRRLGDSLGAVSEIDAGSGSSCLINGGETYCWGKNVDFSLGAGDETPRLIPTWVQGP